MFTTYFKNVGMYLKNVHWDFFLKMCFYKCSVCKKILLVYKNAQRLLKKKDHSMFKICSLCVKKTQHVQKCSLYIYKIFIMYLKDVYMHTKKATK